MICKTVVFGILLSVCINFILAQEEIVFPGPTINYSKNKTVDGLSTSTEVNEASSSDPSVETTTSQSGNDLQLAIRNCVSACPKTSEYNPVCGSDNAIYTNPSYLNCQKECSRTPALKINNYGLCPNTAPVPEPKINIFDK